MKKLSKLLMIVLAVIAAMVALLCVACDGEQPVKPGGDDDGKEIIDPVDYAEEVKLDLTSSTKKQEVTMRLHVDGDTTHFDPKYSSTITCPASDFADTDGYIKARYIAINTPESTGKIEEWGDAASKFTRSKLEGAESIVVESDDENWNIDSSGSRRYVVWVWYKPKGGSDYRNLNIEILQEGLAIGSSVSNNRYGTTAFAALGQAEKLKKHIFSGEKDPDYPYGEATAVSLRELRCNIADYNGKKVKVEGLVTSDISNCVYIEDVDAETGMRFGIQVFYAYETGRLVDILSIGNRVSVVGIVKYYEAGDVYQISDVTHDRFHPKDPKNTTYVTDAEGNPITEEVPFTEVSAHDVVKGTTTVEWTVEGEDEDGNITTETVKKELAFGESIIHTSVAVNNLKITDVYTTKKGTSAGAMSLTCEAEDGTEIVVRTEVLYDKDGNLITEDAFPIGSVINVKGLVDKYDGKYQICVYRDDYITIVE